MLLLSSSTLRYLSAITCVGGGALLTGCLAWRTAQVHSGVGLKSALEIAFENASLALPAQGAGLAATPPADQAAAPAPATTSPDAKPWPQPLVEPIATGYAVPSVPSPPPPSEAPAPGMERASVIAGSGTASPARDFAHAAEAGSDQLGRSSMMTMPPSLWLLVCALCVLLLWLWRRVRARRAHEARMRRWKHLTEAQLAEAGPIEAPELVIPDWLAHGSRASAPAAPAVETSAAGPVPTTPLPRPHSPMPSSRPAAGTPAPSLPHWNTQRMPTATPLNLRGPAAAALTVDGMTIVPSPARPPLQPAVITRHANVPTQAPEEPPATPAAAFSKARSSLARRRPAEALEAVRLVLGPDAPASAWALAGWCSWLLARQQAAPAAATAAIQAFEQALARDPSRAVPLARLIARCHLLQADSAPPHAQGRHVHDAVRTYEMHFVGAPRLGNRAKLEWARGLLRMATHADAAEHSMWLAQLDAVIAGACPDPDDHPHWHALLAEAALLRSRHAPPRASDAPLDAPTPPFVADVPDAIDPLAERDLLLASQIDSQRRQLASSSRAARIAGFQALERRMQKPLAQTVTSPPLLAWVNVLADWSKLLNGPAARHRLAAIDVVFDRIDRLDQVDVVASAFARAYYLRLRASHECGTACARTLDEAERHLALLSPAVPGLDPAMAMERAEIALLRAREARDRIEPYQEAVAHATLAADHASTRVLGLRALLAALLGCQQLVPTAARGRQIEMVAQWLQEGEGADEPETLCLLARAALAANAAAEAARLCAQAWQAGAEGHDILACWQQADAQWARELAQDIERAAWDRQHRLLRLAHSTT